MIAILKVSKGIDTDQGRIAAVGQLGVTIGRGSSSGLRLHKDVGVSREHCRISLADGKVWLADAGSVSGTWVNGVRVQKQELQTGDVIRAGSSEIEFLWSDSDEHTTLGWNPAQPSPKDPSVE